MTHQSDLARRVAHRRTELGMSIDELAQRAGIDPTYMRYFEESADARLSVGSLNLLALVLDTSPADLLDQNSMFPTGEDAPAVIPHLRSSRRSSAGLTSQ